MQEALYYWMLWPLGDRWPGGRNRGLFLRVTLTEMHGLLNGFTVDEIQLFIQLQALQGDLLHDLAPYLTERFRKALGG